MGGKGKQHQRLKNNARPSSSGRCATLLGAASPFSTMATQSTRKDLINLPVIAGDTGKESIEIEVDPQYQILIKKMMKKDPITKVKAMRSFEKLVCDSDGSTLKKILPCWSRHYLNLADDSDHKVREAAQHTHLAIATAAGRNIAVILKQIIPVWITSMFDPYKLASDLARRSLEAAFPQNKLDNAFNFFREEISNTLLTKITREAERYFGVKDPVKLECERIIVSNLRGYALYLEKEKNSDTQMKQKSLLSNEFYWKLADCGSAPIRSAWFECMLSFLQNSLEELLPYNKKFITIAFEHITDVDSNAVTHVWSCILLIQEKFQDWQTYADIKLVIAPKIKTLFENRCFGNSYVISPYYLPFLAKVFDMPVEIHLLNIFVDDFLCNFKSLIIALQKDGNYEEITANVSAFFECLQYVISKKVTQSTNIEETIQLVDNYINGWIVWSIENDNQISKQLYKGVSNAVRNWLENEKNSEYYDKLLETLWKKLKNLIETVNSIENTTNVVEKLLNLFHCLSISKPSQTDGEQNATIRLNEQLKPLSVKLTKVILKKAVQEYDVQYFGHLRTVCKVFNDIEFFEEVSENRDLIYLLKQLEVCLLRGSAPALIVDITFEVLQHLKSEERLSFVENLLKNSNHFAQQWILQKLLSRPVCMETETQSILAQKYVRDILIRIANNFVEENTTENLPMLQQCFSQTDRNHDLIIGEETLIEIIDILTTPFEKIVNTDVMEQYGSFFVDIAPNLSSAKNNTALLETVFIHLSKLLVKASIKNFMSEELFERMLKCWQNILKETCFTINENMMSDCAHLVKQEMKNIDVTIQNINDIANLVFDLLGASKKDCEQEQTQNTEIAMISKIFSNHDSSQTVSQLENYCRYSGWLKGFLVSKPIAIVELPDWNLIQHLIVLNSFQLHLICLHLSENENKSQNSENCSNAASIVVDEKFQKWEPYIFNMILDVLKISAISLEMLDQFPNEIKVNVAEIISTTKQKLTTFLNSVNGENRNTLIELVCERLVHDTELWAQTIIFFIDNGVDADAKTRSILDEFTGNKKVLSSQTTYFVHQVLCLSYPRAIPFEEEYFFKEVDLVFRVAKLRIYINNYFTSDINYISDKAILKTFQHLLSEIVTMQKTSENLLNSNEDISTASFDKVVLCAEIAKLITECLIHFPLELNVEHWDFIRVTLSRWILLLSRSLKDYKLPQVAMFMCAVYKMHAALYRCFEEFKIKSSTFLLTTVIDEWENLFKVETTLVLFKTFQIVLTSVDETDNTYKVLYDAVCPHMEFLDFGIVIDDCVKNYDMPLDEYIQFLLNAFFSKVHSVRLSGFAIFRQLIPYLVQRDTSKLDKPLELAIRRNDNWYLLCRMYPKMAKCADRLGYHLQEFDFKLTNIPELSPIHRETLLGYLLLWDSAIQICSAACVELRSIYAQWITSNHLDEVYLPLLFRAMPVEILKNYDSQVIKNDVFKPLEWMQMKDQNLATERYACHLYAQTLRCLPAVVRRWWNESNPRQKAFVDKLTTNYVSNLLCQEELRSITNKRTEHENMQVTVHNSTREVIATYSIDETKMELVICLARNHPLGSAKIESEKLIGGRSQSRVIVRDLTIYLTHQNGSILDVLSLWKKNLDKKFEGVEECYVCYSVIHQDTCQLPKLTCKTCRKKFHGPCLYKWFTTSSKSTCPICRNVF